MLHVVVLVQSAGERQALQTDDDAGQDQQQLIGRRILLVLALKNQATFEATTEVDRIEEVVERVEPAVVREVMSRELRMYLLEAFDHFLYLYHFDTGSNVPTKSQNVTFVLYLQAHSRVDALT